jgi:hypothetical protein
MKNIKLFEYKNNWITYYPFICGFGFAYNKAGYLDSRPYIYIKLIGELFIHLPFDSKIYSSSSHLQYGLYYSEKCLWISFGEKLKSIQLFWYKQWIRTSYLLKDNTWLTKTKNNRIDVSDFRKDLWKEQINYKYKINNGTIIDVIATINIEEREWRYKIIKWIKLFPDIIRCISIDLSTDIGKGRGSYKGGISGFSISYKKGETYEQILDRMEKKHDLYSIEKERMKKIKIIYEFI